VNIDSSKKVPDQVFHVALNGCCLLIEQLQCMPIVSTFTLFQFKVAYRSHHYACGIHSFHEAFDQNSN